MIETTSAPESESGLTRKEAQAALSPANPPVPRLAFTMEETAQALGVSYITVQRLVKRGLLKSSSALRHKIIPASEIQRFLNDTLK